MGASTAPAAMLQWGRNLFVAECIRGVLDTAHNHQASMGPQLVRCGMCTRWYWRCSIRRCFNGAATCSLRNVNLRNFSNTHRESFNGAATCSLRNENAQYEQQPQSQRRFNGAATCSLRNGHSALLRYFPDLQLQWGRNLFVAECTIAPRVSGSLCWSLQWGRNLFVAECSNSQWAGMTDEELQWGRNLFVAECMAGSMPNSCMTLLQWGRNLFVAE